MEVVRFINPRRARLLLLVTAVAIYAALFLWTQMAPAPSSWAPPERESVAPPFPTHEESRPPLA